MSGGSVHSGFPLATAMPPAPPAVTTTPATTVTPTDANDAREAPPATRGLGRTRPTRRKQDETDSEGDEDDLSETLARLCRKLRVTMAELLRLNPALLDEAIATLQLPLAARARISLELPRAIAASKADNAAATAATTAATPPTTAEGTLAEFFREKEERAVYPWKVAAARARIHEAHVTTAFGEKGAFETLKRTFCSQAKAGALSAVEALVLHQLLFFGDTEFGRFSLASLLLNTPAAQRIELHNWGVARLMAPSRRETFGDRIASLPCPLFPELDELMAINARLLNDAPPIVHGGGRSQPTAASRAFTTRVADPLWGGGWQPPVSEGPNGPYVDVGVVEAAVADIYSRTAALQEQIVRLNAAPRPQRQPQQQQQQYNGQAQYGQPRGRGRGGRGRGRSRGRGHWQGGGDDTFPEDAPKNGDEPGRQQ